MRERGIARLEWDLIPYSVCHIHGIVLQDTCRACGKAISPSRPALDVCGCGGYFAARENETISAPPCVRLWSAWLSQQLLASDGAPQSQDLLRMAPQLYGMSPDGAFRLIHAFAGGAKAFRGELTQSEKPWLGSLEISHLLELGLESLSTRVSGGELSPVKSSTPYALAEQVSAGITAWDRAGAGREMQRLRLGRRWRNAFPSNPVQQELFAEELRGPAHAR